MDIGLTLRKEILATSLVVENLSSVFLGSLLGIKDIKNSRTLGHKGGCLSFNQKIDLLIEIGALSKDDRNKYQAFMEIRNQFMHNLEAVSFEKCFDYTNGTDKFLLKTYPQNNKLSREKQLKEAVNLLGDEIIQLTISLKKRIEEKIAKDVEADIYKKSQQAVIDSIEQIKTTLDEYFEEEIAKKSTYETKRLKGFGTEISKIIYGLWTKKFNGDDNNKSSNINAEPK